MTPKGKVPTKLQSIASERNWLKGYVLNCIYLQPSRHLMLSTITCSQLEIVNKELAKLRYLVDLDWDCQRRQIKKEHRRMESNG